MKPITFDVERYQFHYGNTDSGIRGLGGSQPAEVTIDLGNIIMIIDHTIYARVNEHEYCTLLVNKLTMERVKQRLREEFT